MTYDLKELKVIRENPVHYDIIEKKIKEVFKEKFYLPLIYILNLKESLLKNSDESALQQAILSGKVYYADGRFYGKFGARISKEILSYGGEWDRKTSSFKIKESRIPYQIKNAISLSRSVFQTKLDKIDRQLANISPEGIADSINIASQFDSTLWDVERQFKKSVEKITIPFQLDDEQRKKVADEWETNMRLYIKNFTEEEIIKLRQKVKENVYSGIRRENLIQGFMDSYGVTKKKAKFWAHQETNLLMAKYKEQKYVEAGVPDYKWGCVHMPHQKSPDAIYKPGEVRYSHGILEGKIFSWNDPPITTAPGQQQRRNNPGQDYNCRCFAIPVVRFKK